MYDAIPDPYCYPDSDILRNIQNFRDQASLDQFETVMTAWRSTQPMPPGQLSVTHYKRLHYHLFQDVYSWAGKFRTVRISKKDSMFCYPENISGEMNILFDKLRQEKHLKSLELKIFAHQAAHFLAELNAIHPFREGNGRTQLAFLTILASQAGHPINFERINPEDIMLAMIKSFHGKEMPLATIICDITNNIPL